uniref:Cytochrome c oxidase subunit 2 n=2 Tax=Physopelta TaxID=209985 RepID=B7SMK7_9HEMI|nr:cytochrome c oxidase subunit II [Physopelta gutta]YP_009643417.1 cytochrome c oxidase subunit II [Physopelta cincticollis]ABZ02101.1 cytochrome c oxidase subunit II [Physopelta gutta]APO08847.1 cytochrome c oxidase subunit II [Physopelta cincticollis]
MATWGMMNLQDAMSPLMEQLIMFHDHTITILTMITTLVTYIMMSLMMNKYINRYLLEEQLIELIWTLLPAVTLIFIALPSLHLLYLIDEMNNPLMTLKTIGHQWYWSYEYSDFNNIEFDSYMKSNEKSNFRLLDVDNRVILPINTSIRLLVTATDVLHSWAMPSLGVKIDATPGRLNQSSIFINQASLLFGQCSEICGANHSFMPIVIESVPMNKFITWLNSN